MRIFQIVLLLGSCGLLFSSDSQAVAQQPAGDALATEVIAQEKLAWEAAKKKDKAALAKLLADDFTEIIDDGVFDKGGILAYLDNVQLVSYSPSNFKARTITPDAVLLIFQVTEEGKYKGHDFHAQNNVASLWAKRNGMWQNVHFQETPFPKPVEVLDAQ
jgi:hypothetical protein